MSAAPSPRALGTVCAALAGAAALLGGSSVTTWFVGSGPGGSAVELTGAEVSAAPGAVAVLALAGVAAVVATAGWGRRAIGLLLALAGVAVAVVAVPAMWIPPVRSTQGGPVLTGPLLAVAGAVVLLAAGLFVLLREPRLARPGSRFGGVRAPSGDVEPDRLAWSELDAGRDPTVDRDPGG